jgi:hypothetical protein
MGGGILSQQISTRNNQHWLPVLLNPACWGQFKRGDKGWICCVSRAAKGGIEKDNELISISTRGDVNANTTMRKTALILFLSQGILFAQNKNTEIFPTYIKLPIFDIFNPPPASMSEGAFYYQNNRLRFRDINNKTITTSPQFFSFIGVANGGANAQIIPASTDTQVTIFQIFQHNNQYDIGEFDLIENAFKITDASQVGTYHVDLKLNLFATAAPANSLYTVWIRKNGSNYRISNFTAPSDVYDFNTSFNVELTLNDEIEIWVRAPMSFKIYASSFSSFSGYKMF